MKDMILNIILNLSRHYKTHKAIHKEMIDETDEGSIGIDDHMEEDTQLESRGSVKKRPTT